MYVKIEPRVVTVSYTHLDVYKRQLQKDAKGWQVMIPAKYDNGHEQHFAQVAVSYTHLDVYKRQVRFCLMTWT